MKYAPLLLLVGCYSPSDQACAISCVAPSDCPGDLVCATSGLCGAASDDCSPVPGDGLSTGDVPVKPDAGPLVPCSLENPTTTTQLPIDGLDGRSFSATNSSRALFSSNTNQPLQTTIDGANPTVVMFDAGATEVLSFPMLDPSIDEAFFVAGGNKLARSTRDPATELWSIPQQVTVMSVTIGLSTRFGQPSATTPRHMLEVTQQELREAVEANGNWNFSTVIDFSGLIVIGSPSLSSDGTTLMFIGTSAGDPNNKVFISRRTVLGGNFQPPTMFLDNPGGISGETDVTIAPDCTAVFVSAGGQIIKVN